MKKAGTGAKYSLLGAISGLLYGLILDAALGIERGFEEPNIVKIGFATILPWAGLLAGPFVFTYLRASLQSARNNGQWRAQVLQWVIISLILAFCTFFFINILSLLHPNNNAVFSTIRNTLTNTAP